MLAAVVHVDKLAGRLAVFAKAVEDGDGGSVLRRLGVSSISLLLQVGLPNRFAVCAENLKAVADRKVLNRIVDIDPGSRLGQVGDAEGSLARGLRAGRENRLVSSWLDTEFLLQECEEVLRGLKVTVRTGNMRLGRI